MKTPFNSSPSRTYVARVFNIDFTSVSFKQFTLPDDVENTSTFASWYFYNRLDVVACGDSVYPIEMHNNIEKI